MQQLLRRSLRNPPQALVDDHELLAALSMLAAQAAPPANGSVRSQRRGAPTRWAGPARDENVVFFEVDDSPSDFEFPHALIHDTIEFETPVLNQETREKVAKIIEERDSPRLKRWNIAPISSVLFTGPPGTGKTLTARSIANELDKPLYTLNLATVTSRELGESAKNLTAAIEFAQASGAVLFLDEFDAIASSRTDSNDVGEMRRLVNVLLLALDRWGATSLLIAATNHGDLLDQAISRRFDETIAFSVPDADARKELWLTRMDPQLTEREGQMLAAITDGLTGSDIARMINRCKRDAALHDRAPDFRDAATEALKRHHGRRVPERDQVLAQLRNFHLTYRDIAALAGMSHVAVQDAVKRITAPDPQTDLKSRRKANA